MKVTVYSLEFCPHCDELKKFLAANGKDYNDLRMDGAEGKTELSFNGVFEIEAPVLQVGDKFFVSSQLFPCGELDEKGVLLAVEGEI